MFALDFLSEIVQMRAISYISIVYEEVCWLARKKIRASEPLQKQFGYRFGLLKKSKNGLGSGY